MCVSLAGGQQDVQVSHRRLTSRQQGVSSVPRSCIYINGPVDSRKSCLGLRYWCISHSYRVIIIVFSNAFVSVYSLSSSGHVLRPEGATGIRNVLRGPLG